MVLGLRLAGFKLVSHRDVYGPRSSTDDPEIISYCGIKRNKMVLITADQDMEFTYAPEIRKARVAIFIVTNNHEGPDKWLPRIVSAKLDMERELSTRAKSFAARISTEGRVTQVRRYFKKKDKVWHLGPKKHLLPISTHPVQLLLSNAPLQPF
ncbi:MAG: hypothetical protein ABSC21_02720 [Terriglobia bacterium]